MDSRLFLFRHSGRTPGWLVWREAGAEIVDQRLTIARLNLRSPPDHLIDLSGPRVFTEPLLRDNARVMTDGAGVARLFLHRSPRQVGGLRWLLPTRAEKGQAGEGQNDGNTAKLEHGR